MLCGLLQDEHSELKITESKESPVDCNNCVTRSYAAEVANDKNLWNRELDQL